MKKIFMLMIVLTFALTGCGTPKDGEIFRVGTLTQLNSTPKEAAIVSGGTINFYDNFKAMQMALSSKRIDAIQTYRSVAKYMTAHDSKLAVENIQNTVALVDNFCCAVRDSDIDLKNALDAAIGAMKADGTLDALIEQFINNPTETPPAVTMPNFDGAQTIKVGVTGDLPPLDLVLADGTPAGFNTAVLAEISNRTQTNINLVQIESGARAVALTSKQVDVIFWVVVPDDSKRPKDFDTPAGVAVTAPYYQDVVVNVNLSNLGAGF